MPIYAYRCGDCGFEKDVLQKFADAPLTDCPQCLKPAFGRMVTAPTFQLKGTGWYVTDFRGGKSGGGGQAGEAGSGGGDAAAGGKGGDSAGTAPAGDAGSAPAAASKPAAADSPATGASAPKAS